MQGLLDAIYSSLKEAKEKRPQGPLPGHSMLSLTNYSKQQVAEIRCIDECAFHSCKTEKNLKERPQLLQKIS
jgi:hypothetical protein